MANNNGRRCGRRNYYGCLERVNGRWENYPYYNGCCPDVNGACGDPRDEDREDCGCGRERRRACRQCGIFTATLPMAMAANGVVPLVGGACMGLNNDFPVSCGIKAALCRYQPVPERGDPPVRSRLSGPNPVLVSVMPFTR